MTKLTVSTTELVNALTKLIGIVENRNTIPILANVSIHADGDNLKISATDMDINASVLCKANVEKGGSFTVPARNLFEIAKRSSSDDIKISWDGSKANISAGRSRFNLGTLPFEEFPSFNVAKGEGFNINGNELLTMINDAAVSMSDDETRHYLNGIYFHDVEGKLRAVATNGNTLAQSDGQRVSEFPSAIIPRKTVGVLQGLLSGFNDDVNVLFVDNKVQLTIGGLVLVSKIIDGTFPDYQRIIPREYKGQFIIDTQAAMASVDRLCIIDDKLSNAIKISVIGGVATLERFGTDENAVDTVDAEGDDFIVHLNSKYLADALKKIRTGKTIVHFNDEKSAVLFTAENDDTASWLVMPTKGRAA